MLLYVFEPQGGNQVSILFSHVLLKFSPYKAPSDFITPRQLKKIVALKKLLTSYIFCFDSVT